MQTIPNHMYEDPNSSFILSLQNLKLLLRETDGLIFIGGIFREISAKKLHDERFKIKFEPRYLY